MNIRANVTFKAGSFARLEAVIVPRIIAAVDAGTEVILATSQQLVPVLGGSLLASGSRNTQWKSQLVTGTVMYTAPHAMFVEFGTGIIGSGTYPYELPQEGVPITGSWIYDYKMQNWQGMSARPYLRPALDNNLGNITSLFGKHGL